MSQTDSSLTGTLRAELRQLAVELRELTRLRFELARIELADSARRLRRLVIAIAVALLLVLISLPVFVVALAELLDGLLGIARAGWLLILGGALVISAGSLAALFWFRFRRCFTGLRDTLAELREDAVWLSEWTGGAENQHGQSQS